MTPRVRRSKKRRPKFAFEKRETAGKGGLNHTEMPGRGSYAVMLGYGDNFLELMQFHSYAPAMDSRNGTDTRLLSELFISHLSVHRLLV